MKGSVLIPIVAIMAIFFLAIGSYAMWTWGKSNEASTEAQQLSILESQGSGLQELRGTDTPVTGTGTSGGLYDYTNIQPYVNFLTQDQGGTARNPTWYFYDSDPNTIGGKEGAWGSEREWTDTSGEYFDSGTATSGKLSKQFSPGQTIWAHGSVSGYEDLFVKYIVPARGDVTPGDAQSSSIGLDALGNAKRIGTYDTTAWTSSALNVSVSVTANSTDARHSTVITRTVTQANKVKLDRIMANNVTDFVSNGVRRFYVTLSGFDVTKPNALGEYPNGRTETISIYDVNGADKRQNLGGTLGLTYDSNSYTTDKAKIRTIGGANAQTLSLQVVVYADVNTDNIASTLAENDIIADDFLLEDVEGNNLILQDVIA